MDLAKWADQALLLAAHGTKLLSATHIVKRVLEEDSKRDFVYKGGQSDVTLAVNGSTLKPETPNRHAIPGLDVMLDAQVLAMSKGVVKKFPDLALLKVPFSLL